MNITQLRLTDFRRHADLNVELKPGLNIVRGPNEAGKSTIQRAIELALFRRPTFASAELDDLRPWQRPDADPTIELEFDHEGQHGVMRKVFAGQRGTVEFTWEGDTLTDPTAVEAEIARLTGLPSEKFLRATASVHHQELAGLSQDESTLRDRLQQSMSGADRGTQSARRKLEDVIRRYRTEGAKNPGYLKVMRADVDRLSEQKRTGEAALTQLEADRRELAATRDMRHALDTQMAEHVEKAAAAEHAKDLAARAVDAGKRYALYKRAAELREDVDALEAAHPSAVALPILRKTVDHVRQLEFRLSELRAELAVETDLSAYDVAVSKPRWKPWAALALLLVVAGAAAVVGGVLAGVAIIGVIAGVVLVGFAAGAVTVARRERRRLKDVMVQIELREAEIARHLAGRNQLNDKVRQAEQERSESLGSLHQPDVAAAERILAAETEHVAQIENKQAEYRGLMGDEAKLANSYAEIAGLRDRAAAEADECRHSLAGMGEIGADPDRHLAAANVSLKRFTPEREAALQAEMKAEARVTNNAIDAEQVATVAESLEQAEESLAAAERRLRIYEDVLATLNNSERGTMQKAARFLEQRMARDIERVTGGRYRRLQVDEQTLTFTVFAPELNDWIDVSRLSQGTLDQLYLCARLGIVRQVTEPGTPPLLFDDPFVTFDAERAERALKMLKELATDFQIIFITCSDRYDAVADNVVVLPAPLERDEPDPVDAAPTGEAISMWSTSSLPAASAPHAANGSGPAANGNGRAAANPPATPVAPLWPDEH